MRTITVQDVAIPAIGLGTWQLRGADAERLTAAAVEMGYRHVDTARAYENEASVGAGLRASGVNREEVFLTTKIWPTDHRPDDSLRAAADSVKTLGVGPVDLLLLHWPSDAAPLSDIIAALNKCRAEGLTRHIGVSNYNRRMMTEAVALSEAPLLTNQVEYHPYLDQSILL